jgi:DNA polymerase III delta prime subunit
MSNEKAAEQKYFEKLNISVLSINRIKDILKNDILDTVHAWKEGTEVDKQCYRIIGPAGVGKTQICYQIAGELTEELFGEHNKENPDDQKKFDCMMVKAPVLSRDDFIIPFPVKSAHNGEEYTFKMLYSDFVPKEEDSYGLFVIDECSRGDRQLQQLMWQIQNEYAIHCHKFPKHWFVISIDNPDDAEYYIDNLEDAAGLRRQLHIYSEVNVIDFLNYAIENKFHPLVVEFIQAHGEYLYDFQAQKIGAVYANPASYEKLSDHLKKMEARRGSIDFNEIEIKAAGLLNTSMTRLFIDFAKDQKSINPKDVFHRFPEIRNEVTKFVKEGNNPRLGELMSGFCNYLVTSMPKCGKKELNNILDFILLMPIDTSALFITQVDSLSRNSKALAYINQIHERLMELSDKYRTDFFEPIDSVVNS